MLFIKDERRESFYPLRRLFILSARVCVCVHIKGKFTFDPPPVICAHLEAHPSGVMAAARLAPFLFYCIDTRGSWLLLVSIFPRRRMLRGKCEKTI